MLRSKYPFCSEFRTKQPKACRAERGCFFYAPTHFDASIAWFPVRFQDFSCCARKILSAPNSEQNSPKPAAQSAAAFFMPRPTSMHASRGSGHKKSLQLSLQALSFFALRDRGRIRTFNRLIRSQVLYPVELHGHHPLRGGKYRAKS